MNADLHGQIAALKNTITDLRNQIDEHDIAEQNWRDRERELLAANTRFEQRGRLAENAIRLLEEIIQKTRAYSAPECDENDITGPLLKKADWLIAEYRKEYPR